MIRETARYVFRSKHTTRRGVEERTCVLYRDDGQATDRDPVGVVFSTDALELRILGTLDLEAWTLAVGVLRDSTSDWEEVKP